jgi:hypothetical protein
VFLFEEYGHGITLCEGETCRTCGFWNINKNYIKIIQQLKEAGLIEEDYPIMCCECYAELAGKKRKRSEGYL